MLNDVDFIACKDTNIFWFPLMWGRTKFSCGEKCASQAIFLYVEMNFGALVLTWSRKCVNLWSVNCVPPEACFNCIGKFWKKT